jgi:hypothetical protein
MTPGHSLPDGLYEALLSVIREGYPGNDIKPLTNAQLAAIEHDMDQLAQLRADNPVDLRAETDAYLQEIVRVTLENSGLQI